MKIGLVARADSTGLGVQTMEFFHHMSVKKVLILDLCNFGDKNLVLFPERFLNENGTLSGRVFQGIPDSEVLDWFLEDLDVVYTAETPYNYELFRKAEERGVKTILHMNPEFNYYHFNQVAPRPSAIALPTHWKKDEVSLSTHVLPVPVAAERFTDRGSEEREGKIVHFLHVVGHPAIHDRNGTRDLIAALSHVTQPMTITFTCQKKDYVWDLMKEVAGLSGILDFPNDVVVINDPVTYENYWDIYSSAEFDALVMPRRYGGLCLPAQEALASGLPVIMPNISPNNDLLPSEWLTPAETYGQFMAAMPVDLYRTDPKILAGYLDRFADREWLDAQRSKAILYAAPISWAQQKPQYESFFQAVVAGYVPLKNKGVCCG